MQGVPDALSFANPPLFKFLLLGVDEALFHLGQQPGLDTSPLFLVARGTSAVLGALTIVGVYWLARSLRGERAALIAAGLASATYLLVRESHFAVNDALVTLCVTMALVCCVRVAGQGRRRDYVAAGAAVGLAFAAKYQAAAVGVPLVLAHLLSRGPRRRTDLGLGLGVAMGTALVAFPSLVLEPGRVLADVYVFDVLPARLGYDGIDPQGGYGYYIQALGVGLGWPMLVLAGVGLARAVVRREAPLLVIASFPVLLFATLGASHMYFARFLFRPFRRWSCWPRSHSTTWLVLRAWSRHWRSCSPWPGPRATAFASTTCSRARTHAWRRAPGSPRNFPPARGWRSMRRRSACR